MRAACEWRSTFARDAVVFGLDSALCVTGQGDGETREAVFERVGREPFFEPADRHAVEVTDLPEAESDGERYVHLSGAAAASAGATPGVDLLDAPADATPDVGDSTPVGFRGGAREALSDVL